MGPRGPGALAPMGALGFHNKNCDRNCSTLTLGVQPATKYFGSYKIDAAK